MTERDQPRDAERLPEEAARRLLARASELEAARGAELSVAELREVAHRAHRACVVSYIFALALQFYIAGLALFGAASFVPHALLGYGLVVGAVTLTALTVAARFPRRTVWLATSLVPLTLLQPVLALALRPSAPALAALHTLNALLIFSLAVSVAQRTRPSRVVASGRQ